MPNSLDQAIAERTIAHPLAWLTSRQTFWVFLAVALAAATLSVVTDTFATDRNIFNVTRNFAFVGIVALGMTTVIITRGIDLSVGSTVVMAAIVTGVVMAAGYSIWVAVALAIGAALLIGLINGVLIAIVGMPSFVVTLGMLSVARSIAMVLSQNKMIYQFGPDHAKLLWLGGGSTFGIPHPVVVLAVMAFLLGFALRWTQWGRHIFAI